MDQQNKSAAKSSTGLWTKVILVVLAGLVGYFIGRGNSGQLAVTTPEDGGEELGLAETAENLVGEAMEGEEAMEIKTPTPAPAPRPATPAPTPVTSPSTSMTDASIAVDAQSAGTTVVIRSMSLKNRSWIAIHDDRNGAPGNILGAQRFEANETVGSVSLLRATQAGMRYFAVVHMSDDDMEFEFKTADAPLIGKNGGMVMAAFTANP